MYDEEWVRTSDVATEALYQIRLVSYSDGSVYIVVTTNGRTVIAKKALHPMWVPDLLAMLGVDRETQRHRDLSEKLAKCESPIERDFLAAIHPLVPRIEPQFWVGNYRVDFAIPDFKIAVELDGHEYHSSREQRTSDAQREREIEREGWKVFRFTGTEIHASVNNCAYEFYQEMYKIGAAEPPF